ncbi:MAG TPA: DegT/DnrJ/EryC1/StrS family aminotransferase [Nitrososphaera sp.]|jgi:dTDP-4-amino-4,6-dideoxygalactose transaminase|nr:DegT/DnrJ/EryC1/StrS family aminotransferase [Nitrososphaera sp.]
MIPINKPWIGEEEKREVTSVLEENALTTAARDGGKRVRDFESQMKDYLKCKHVLAVNSGTAALHAALLAAGVQQGDEVLIPSFTFVATANAVVAAGGKPVFVDVKKDDYTIDVSDLKSKITKKSKVVIPVHLYGHPSDMDEIAELADKHSLDIIEDACQSLGSTYKNKQTGTFGAMGCFSMYASKVLTAGEGGAISTDSDELADKIKMIRNHGMIEGYDTRILGMNLRLPELSAAVAKVQMQKLGKMLEIRRRNAELLSKLLFPSAKKSGMKIPEETADKKFNWYLYTVAFESNRDKIKEKLMKDNIGATVYYSPPVHKTPFYMQVAPGTKLQSTEWCADHVLSLPVHPHVSEAEIEQIANSLNERLRNNVS